jgi:hypothetical protein
MAAFSAGVASPSRSRAADSSAAAREEGGSFGDLSCPGQLPLGPGEVRERGLGVPELFRDVLALPASSGRGPGRSARRHAAAR